MTLPGGDVVVADAAANAIVQVRATGRAPRVIAVLPPVEIVVTEEILAGINASQPADGQVPGCTLGLTYLAEPVPTDVELGVDGRLYVTTLPGAPGEGGPYGAVHRVNPWNGKQEVLATGFTAATGLALTPWGDIYVSELMGGRVSVLPRGSATARPYLQLGMPSAVEWENGTLYVTDGGLMGPDGRLLKTGAPLPVRR